MPKLQANLLSVSKLVIGGMKVQFNVDGCTLKAPNGDVIAVAPCEGNLYQVSFNKVLEVDAANLVQPSRKGTALELWHRRLGHLNVRSVRFLGYCEDSTSVGRGLEMSPSGSNETPLLVLVDESSKPNSEDGEAKKEEPVDAQDEGASEAPSSMPIPSGSEEEGSAQESRYPRRERRPLGEWWMNHILPQHEVERANVAHLEDPLNMYEAMQSENASKWEKAMHKEYDSLMQNGTWELAPHLKDRKSIGCKWVFLHKEGCFRRNCAPQGKIGGQGILSSGRCRLP